MENVVEEEQHRLQLEVVSFHTGFSTLGILSLGLRFQCCMQFEWDSVSTIDFSLRLARKEWCKSNNSKAHSIFLVHHKPKLVESTNVFTASYSYFPNYLNIQSILLCNNYFIQITSSYTHSQIESLINVLKFECQVIETRKREPPK